MLTSRERRRIRTKQKILIQSRPGWGKWKTAERMDGDWGVKKREREAGSECVMQNMSSQGVTRMTSASLSASFTCGPGTISRKALWANNEHLQPRPLWARFILMPPQPLSPSSITLTVPSRRRRRRRGRSVSLLLLMLCALCRAAGALIHHRNRRGRKRLSVNVARCGNDWGAH